MSSLTDGHATICFAVRFHRGGKLFNSHGRSLWAGKLAVLLRLHHSRHSRQLASIVKDLPLCGMNKIGCSMNKIGLFIKSKHRAGHTRCVPEQNRVVRGEHFLGAVIGAVLRANTEKTVWGAARTQGVVGSGARTRFGGVLQTCVSAPRREKKGTRFCSETTRVYPILSISLPFLLPGGWIKSQARGHIDPSDPER